MAVVLLPDGHRLAFVDFSSGKGDLWTVPVDNGMRAGKPEVFLQNPATECSRRSLPTAVGWHTRPSRPDPLRHTCGRFLTTVASGRSLTAAECLRCGRPNGRELFYRTPDHKIMIVSYTTKGDHFVPEKPRLWSSTKVADTGFHRNLDIGPDGKRFIALVPAEEQGSESPRDFFCRTSSMSCSDVRPGPSE